jgi:hypothetical protein
MKPSTDIRRAIFEDLDFMLWVDAHGEGYTQEDELPTAQEQAHQRSKFESLLTSPKRAAWVAEQGTTLPQAGLAMCTFPDMEDFGPGTPGVDFIATYLVYGQWKGLVWTGIAPAREGLRCNGGPGLFPPSRCAAGPTRRCLSRLRLHTAGIRLRETGQSWIHLKLA